MVRVKCSIMFRRRVRFWLRVLVRDRVRSQEVPGTESTAVQLCTAVQLSAQQCRIPRRAELRAHGIMPVIFSISVPIPNNCMGHWSCRPQQSFQEAAAGPEKRHAEVPGSIRSDPALLLYPSCVVFSDFGFGCPWVRALARVWFHPGLSPG